MKCIVISSRRVKMCRKCLYGVDTGMGCVHCYGCEFPKVVYYGELRWCHNYEYNLRADIEMEHEVKEVEC